MDRLKTILRHGDISLEDYVEMTDAVIAISEGNIDVIEATYEVLSTIEDAIYMPAVYTVITEEGSPSLCTCSKYVEVPLKLAEEIMFIGIKDAAGNVISQSETGKEVNILITNLEPSAFPTVDIDIVIDALLGYGVDYKEDVLRAIKEDGICIANIADNRVKYLKPLN